MGERPSMLMIFRSLGLILLLHPFYKHCAVSSLLRLKRERSMSFVECIWNASVMMTAILSR